MTDAGKYLVVEPTPEFQEERDGVMLTMVFEADEVSYRTIPVPTEIVDPQVEASGIHCILKVSTPGEALTHVMTFNLQDYTYRRSDSIPISAYVRQM